MNELQISSGNEHSALVHEADFMWDDLSSQESRKKIQEIVLQLIEERLDGIPLTPFDKEILDAYLAKLQIFTTVSQTLKFRSDLLKDKYTRLKKYKEAIQLIFSDATTVGGILDPAIYLPQWFFLTYIPARLLHELSHEADKLIYILLIVKIDQSEEQLSSVEVDKIKKKLKEYEKYLVTSENPLLSLLALLACFPVYITVDRPSAYFFIMLILLLSVINTLKYVKSPDEISARKTEKRITKIDDSKKALF